MDEKVRNLLKKGDIVQIRPDMDATYGGCLMVVTKTHGWGVDGYIMIPGVVPEYINEDQSGKVDFRCHYNYLVETGGEARYVTGDDFDGEEITDLASEEDFGIANDNQTKH